MSAREESLLLTFVQEEVERGHSRHLRGSTFTAPRKWMKGKGRITVQYVDNELYYMGYKVELPRSLYFSLSLSSSALN